MSGIIQLAIGCLNFFISGVLTTDGFKLMAWYSSLSMFHACMNVKIVCVSTTLANVRIYSFPSTLTMRSVSLTKP
jgi:hypothetical protein